MRLEPITPDNVLDACALEVRPEQKDFVAPVAWSLALAYVHPEMAWPRLVYDGDELVAFIMGGFREEDGELEGGIWRLNVGADHQGHGYGRYAVDEFLAEARRRGLSRVRVSWVPGENSPEGFYFKLGFRPTGEVEHGEVLANLDLEGEDQR